MVKLKRLKNLGPYRINKKLGSGAFGEVVLGTHTPSGEEVAIKLFHKAECEDQDRAMMLIRREAHCGRRVQHQHVSRLLQILESPTLLALVFEFAQEDCLVYLDRCKSKGTSLSEPTARVIFRSILSAVEAIHAAGVIHRDIKPENVCIISDLASLEIRDVKLIDFGLSNTVTAENPHLMTKCGSTGYSAPELLIEEQTYGKEVDVWSLGSFLFAILHGRMPFGNPSLEGHTSVTDLLALMYDHRYTLDDGKSVAANNMFGKIFQHKPNNRITIEELWQDDWVTGCGLEHLGVEAEPRIELVTTAITPDTISRPCLDLMVPTESDYESVVSSVTNNLCDEYCASYFLSNRKLERKRAARLSLSTTQPDKPVVLTLQALMPWLGDLAGDGGDSADSIFSSASQEQEQVDHHTPHTTRRARPSGSVSEARPDGSMARDVGRGRRAKKTNGDWDVAKWKMRQSRASESVLERSGVKKGKQPMSAGTTGATGAREPQQLRRRRSSSRKNEAHAATQHTQKRHHSTARRGSIEIMDAQQAQKSSIADRVSARVAASAARDIEPSTWHSKSNETSKKWKERATPSPLPDIAPKRGMHRAYSESNMEHVGKSERQCEGSARRRSQEFPKLSSSYPNLSLQDEPTSSTATCKARDLPKLSSSPPRRRRSQSRPTQPEDRE